MAKQQSIFKLVRMAQYPILEQLQLEQALLRVAKGSWMLINDGTPDPAIVMGVSGKLDELVHKEQAAAADMTVIRRFSGGGTVAVDPNTVFATLISDECNVPEVEAYPRPLMRWTANFYSTVFGPYGDFQLQENDYCFGNSKFGGNAQAITRRRWLHHTTFLWDYDPRNMALLKHPYNAPEYRQGREHLQFICRLRDYMPSRKSLLAALPTALDAAGFEVQEVGLEVAKRALEQEHFQSTKLIPL